jgi:ABC-type dipeptide/oligopeptide/nickel transport system permease subunit
MGMQLLFLGSIYGVILIPIFTLIITKAKYNFVAILKQVIPYIPLMMGFVLTIDTFLGFLLSSITDLGGVISTASMYLPIAPWATFLPGLALFVLLLGFYLLYAGLREFPGEVQEINRDI